MNRPDLLYTLGIILVAGAVTIGLRGLPFAAFGRNRQTPSTVRYLGGVISPAVISMLTLYCFFVHCESTSCFYLPELLAGLVVVLLQYYRRNPLLSILSGTILYMFLLQVL